MINIKTKLNRNEKDIISDLSIISYEHGYTCGYLDGQLNRKMKFNTKDVRKKIEKLNKKLGID